MSRRRAYILLLTLGLGSMVFLLLLASAPGTMLTTIQLGVEARHQGGDSAGGVQEKAISALLYDNDYNGNLTYQDAQLTFKNANGAAYSLNNYRGKQGKAGWHARQVPAGQVNLVGYARVEGIQRIRQALVEPFHRVMVEDFNSDGQGDQPRLPWLFYPGTTGHLYLQGWCYLGNPQYRKNLAQFMILPNDRWKDYDYQATVAYYGTTSFGFSVRGTNNFDGYRLEIQPRIGLQKIEGIDITATALPGLNGNEIPYPDTAQSIQDPLFSVATDLSEEPAVWRFQVSVKKMQMWLSVFDPNQNAYRQVGTAFDLTKFDDKMVTNGARAAELTSGGVGIWSDVANGIGVTNLVVKVSDRGLMRRNSRWED